MDQVIQIEDRSIGGDNPTFIVAELSANHCQNYDIAIETIYAVKETGADAIKLQTFTPDTITLECETDYFYTDSHSLWAGRTLYDLYGEAYTPWEWQPKLKEKANDLGLICFSSVFDKSSVDFLEEIDIPAYKVASFEITDIPLIRYVASKNKPIMISTGIATLSEIQDALATCVQVGNNQIVLLNCTAIYPTPLEETNLKLIPDLAKRFSTIVGLSDHTLGISVPIASVALGAKVIEKHFILDKSSGGLDADFSLDKEEFTSMVKAVRETEEALGEVTYEISEKVDRSRAGSRSLFIVEDMKKGQVLTEDNVRSIRPNYGLPPKYLD